MLLFHVGRGDAGVRQLMGTAAHIRAWGDGRHAACIRELPCALGGVYCTTQVEAHHVRSIGAGGREQDLIPLCPDHHAELHHSGRETFALRYRVNLEALAEGLWTFRNYPFERWSGLVEAMARTLPEDVA